MHSSPAPTSSPEDGVIDPRQLASRLWRRRRLILAGTAIVIALALTANTLAMKYESVAVYRIDDLGLADYRRLKTLLIDNNRFFRYTKATGVTDTPASRLLNGYLTNEKEFNRLISPTYSLTKADLKQLANTEPAGGNPLMGLRISIRAEEAETSLTATKLLADYLLDTVMLTELTEWVRAQSFANENKRRHLANKNIENRFAIEQNRAKLARLKELLERYPEAAGEGTRQLVSLEQGGSHYLSPLAQVVAQESIIADLELQHADFRRQTEQNRIHHQFFTAALSEVEKATTGRALLDALTPLLERTFAQRGDNDDAIVVAENLLALELDKQHNRYNQEFRFLVYPELPSERGGRSHLLIAAFSGISGLFLMILTALFLDWWRENGDSITADDSP